LIYSEYHLVLLSSCFRLHVFDVVYGVLVPVVESFDLIDILEVVVLYMSMNKVLESVYHLTIREILG